jgi:carboxylesterase
MESAKAIKGFLVSLLMVIVSACDTTPDITDQMLDSKFIYDPSINNPVDYLVSYSNPTPTVAEAAQPVFIAVHGYSASTFEWEEFRTWSRNTNQPYLVSMVLMGGHGRTYEEFKESTWKDWQASIIEEYDRLVAAGYTNIHFLASSTSCTLILDLIHGNYFTGKVIPRNILLVDPIIIPSSKILSLSPALGPILGYVEADNTSEEDRYWYHYRPQETLQQLNKILLRVRKQLEDGFALPAGSNLKIYKSIKDPTADPVSAVLIYKGLKTSTGGKIEVQMVESGLHVFTRLNLRNNVTIVDIDTQYRTFNEFATRVK